MVDRIAAFLAQQERATADVIARDFLRLLSPEGPAAARLVRVVLGCDHRFREEPDGAWQLAPAAPTGLAPPVLLVTLEMPAGSAREPWLWRVSGELWGERGPVVTVQGMARDEALETMLGHLARLPVATDQPGALGRWIRVQEQCHAFPESDPTIIDLRAWRRLMAVGGAATRTSRATRAEAAPIDATALAESLETVIEVAQAAGLRSWRAVAQAPELARDASRDAVWETERGFTRETLDALPEDPGVYRFYAKDGGLLYIGKSKCLRRRVASYFRPSDPDSRRAERLRAIHRLEVETTGSELEALLLEQREIRARRPVWNVQVDVRDERPAVAPGERELLLLLPDATGAGSLFALSGERVALRRFESESAVEAVEVEAQLLAFFGAGVAPEGFVEFPAPDRVLARRWLDWDSPGMTLLRVADFSSFRDLTEAVVAAIAPVASAQDPALTVIVRGRADAQSACLVARTRSMKR
jgi:hypothetical protein